MNVHPSRRTTRSSGFEMLNGRAKRVRAKTLSYLASRRHAKHYVMLHYAVSLDQLGMRLVDCTLNRSLPHEAVSPVLTVQMTESYHALDFYGAES